MERNRTREKQVRSEKGKESEDIGSLTDSGIKKEMGGKNYNKFSQFIVFMTTS